jgi:acetyl esterase/lipase
MIRIILSLTLILNLSFIFPQKNIIDIDSVIKVDNYKVFKNISYGADKKNKLDLWVADTKLKTPFVIYIHGGGFGAGNKSAAYTKDNFKKIKKLLENNISFATIDYRFKNNDDFLLSSFNDAKRALQYLKFYSDKYNLLKSKAALMGASAGATSSLWIGLQDDLSDKKSKDPILRESTKVSCIVGIAAAHSLNLLRWRDMANVDEAYLKSIFEKYLGKMDTEKWMERSFNKNYISEVDFFEKMDSNDPPIFIINYGKNTKPKNIADFHHNPLHAKLLKNRADSLKIKNVVYAPGIGIIDKSNKDMVDFIIENLN